MTRERLSRAMVVFRRGVLWCFVALACVAASGCNGNRMRPEKPELLTGSTQVASPVRYSLTEFNEQRGTYSQHVLAAMGAVNDNQRARYYENARMVRDEIINRIRADIRAHSGEFEDTLRQDIANWSTGMDFVELGLSAATTIVGGESAKTVLAAILTAVKGGRISVDKNFFRERTSEAIIAALRSSRMTQDTLIVSKMSRLNVREYTLDEAMNDLIDLYYAGTLASGFQALAEQAAVKAQEAEAENARVVNRRVRLSTATEDLIIRKAKLTTRLKGATEEHVHGILKRLGDQTTPQDKARAAMLVKLDQLEAEEGAIKSMEETFDAVLGSQGDN